MVLTNRKTMLALLSLQLFLAVCTDAFSIVAVPSLTLSRPASVLWSSSSRLSMSSTLQAVNGVSSPAAAAAASPLPPSSSLSSLPTRYVKCGKCQTIYIINEDDLGEKGHRRLECTVCHHSWFQGKDRLLTLKDGYELLPLPELDVQRIGSNLKQGKPASFLGDCTLYVGNIAFECQEEELLEMFQVYGNVGEVSLVRDEQGRCRGFGFITMRTKQEGAAALQALNGVQLRGRSINVRESNKQT